MGPAGLTVVIAKASLFGFADKDVPVMCDWKKYHFAPDGYYNTPPTFSIFVAMLNAQHMNANGGIPYYKALAEKRSQKLYNAIDKSGGYFINRTQRKFRSRINVVFRLPSPALEAQFI